MLFAIQLRYSLRRKDLEISCDDVAFLQERSIWHLKDDALLERCLQAGPHARAIGMIAIQMRKLHNWITVKSFRSEKTTFKLTMDGEKSEVFEHLVKTGDLMQQLNGKLKEVTNQPHRSTDEANDEEVDWSSLVGVVVTSLIIDPGEPVSILLEDGARSTELDHDALARVLLHENIGDRPIALISIAGAFRKGKSFMLNFFLRYLRNKGYNCLNWMGDADKALDDGFSWKGGCKRHTVGITMWSQPFIVKKDTEEIAVILMDTQGNFDLSSGKEQSTKIFALSMLLSSVLVFNIHHQVQNDDLEYLQFAAEYGKVAKDHEGNLSPFQKLFFLVRDWSNLDDFEYGLTEGIEYLRKEVLNDDPTSPLASVRRHLNDSFKTIQCYLMPGPGDKVVISRRGQVFAGCLKDIKDEFLEHVGYLTETLLKPENLVVKEGMSAQSLMHFTIGCFNAIKSNADGKLPVPTTIMEATAEALAAEALMKRWEEYNEKMSQAEGTDQTFRSWKDFDTKEEEIRKQIEYTFCKSLKFGDQPFKERQKEKLRTTLDRAKMKFKQRNTLYELKEKNDFGGLVTELIKKYKDGFAQLFGDDNSFKDESILEETHKKLSDENLKLFKCVVAKYDAERKFEEEEITLKEEMVDSYELMKLRHSFKRDSLKQTLLKIVCESVQIYEDEMNKALKVDLVDQNEFEIHHIMTEIAVKQHFNSKKDAAPQFMHSASLKQLQQFILDSKQTFLADLERKNKIATNPILKRMKEEYEKFCEKEIDRKILSTAALKNIIEKFSVSARDIYESCTAEHDNFTPESFKLSDWNVEQESMLDALTRRMKFLMAKTESNLLDLKIKQMENIFQQIEKLEDLYYEEEELKTFLRDERQKMLSEMDKAEQDRFLSDDVDKSKLYLKELNEFIQMSFKLARKKHARRGIRIKLQLNLHALQVTLAYYEAMEKELIGAYVEPRVLQEMHVLWVSQIPHSMDGMTEMAYRNHRQQIVETLKEDFLKFLKWNDENKSFVSRIVSRVTGRFASRATKVQTICLMANYVILGSTVALGGITLTAGFLIGLAVAAVGFAVDHSLKNKRIRQCFLSAKAALHDNIAKMKERMSAAADKPK